MPHPKGMSVSRSVFAQTLVLSNKNFGGVESELNGVKRRLSGDQMCLTRVKSSLFQPGFYPFVGHQNVIFIQFYPDEPST